MGLPVGLAYFCPVSFTGTYRYDGAEYGVIANLETGERIFPTGYDADPNDAV
jgi:hypothetical protein